MPGRGWRCSFASQDYWLVAPATTGADRAGGGLIPPFPGNSGAGDGVTVIEPGVMIVRPWPLGIGFAGAVWAAPAAGSADGCCEDLWRK